MESYRKMKAQLLKRKQEIEQSLKLNEEFAEEMPDGANIASGELSGYDNHPADSGTQLYDREKDLVLKRLNQNELEDINAALKKMENGTYGFDEKSGERIPYERLEAMPTARTTVKNARRRKDHKRRPIEESVLADLETSGVTNYQDSGFDEQNAFDIVTMFNDQDLVYDDAPFIDSEAELGCVEAVEGIGATGIEGFRGSEEVMFFRNGQYEKLMDANEDSLI